MKRFWREMTMMEFAGDMSGTIAVLPLAAIEQHGPHLPLGVDTLIAEALVERAANKIPRKSKVVFLPVQAVGKSTEHFAYRGTLNLEWETSVKSWLDIGQSVARAGIKKLVIITSHGGNAPGMEIAALELRQCDNMQVVTTSWEKLGRWREGADAHDIHGGQIETSIMLALHPDLVNMKAAENFASHQTGLKERAKHLGFHSSDARIAWATGDLNELGAVGDASSATAEQGEKLLNSAVKNFCQLVREIDSLPAPGA